jgi:hypothetical protein
VNSDTTRQRWSGAAEQIGRAATNWGIMVADMSETATAWRAALRDDGAVLDALRDDGAVLDALRRSAIEHGRSDPVTELLIDASLSLIGEQGPGALTIRALAGRTH